MSKRSSDDNNPSPHKKRKIIKDGFIFNNNKHKQIIIDIKNCTLNNGNLLIENYSFTEYSIKKICSAIIKSNDIVTFTLNSCDESLLGANKPILHLTLLESLSLQNKLECMSLDFRNANNEKFVKNKNPDTSTNNFPSLKTLNIKNLFTTNSLLNEILQKISKMVFIENLSFEKVYLKTIKEINNLKDAITKLPLKELKLIKCTFSNYESINILINFIKENVTIMHAVISDIKFSSNYTLSKKKNSLN